MGFRKPLDYTSIQHQLYMAGVEVCSSRNDGFTAWSIKQDLYRVKWLIDSIMQQAPQFADEADFVDEHEKQLVFRTLKS
jgi:hypothetical protein